MKWEELKKLDGQSVMVEMEVGLGDGWEEEPVVFLSLGGNTIDLEDSETEVLPYISKVTAKVALARRKAAIKELQKQIDKIEEEM